MKRIMFGLLILLFFFFFAFIGIRSEVYAAIDFYCFCEEPPPALQEQVKQEIIKTGQTNQKIEFSCIEKTVDTENQMSAVCKSKGCTLIGKNTDNGKESCEQMQKIRLEQWAQALEALKLGSAGVGGLGCYCKVGGKITNVTTFFPTQQGCQNASNQSVSELGTLTDCVWNVSGEQELGDGQKEYQESAFKIPKDVSDLNQLGTTNVTEVLGRVIKMVLGITGSIALLMFVYGGVVIMSGSTTVVGGASKRDIAKGQGILVWSAMGLLVIFASYAIVDFIFKAFQ